MPKLNHSRLLLVLAAALALVLTACGGSSSNPQRELADRILEVSEGVFGADSLAAMGVDFDDLVDRSCVRDAVGELSSSDAKVILDAIDEMGDDFDDFAGLDFDLLDDLDDTDTSAFDNEMVQCFDVSAMMGGFDFGESTGGDMSDDDMFGDFDFGDIEDMFGDLDMEDLQEMMENFDMSDLEDLFGDFDMEDFFGN